MDFLIKDGVLLRYTRKEGDNNGFSDQRRRSAALYPKICRS